MRWILTVAVLACQVGLAGAQGPAEQRRGEDGQRSRLREQAGRLLSTLTQLSDWDTHSAYMLEAVEKIYARNGWDSEADAFSLHMVQEVNAIPPWSPLERFDRAVELIGERYRLDERQEQLLREMAIRESNKMFQKHSGRIMQYAVEVIQTRAAGEAFTPEQVARWTRLAEPVFQESRQRLNVAAESLMQELRPDQQALARRDLAAANRRMDHIDAMGERWSRGEWQPSDWGMEEDPIQLAGELRAAVAQRGADAGVAEPPPVVRGPRPAGRSAQPVPRVTPRAASGVRPPTPVQTGPRSVPPGRTAGAVPGAVQVVGEKDPWAQYVQRFIDKYKLDEAQQSKAWKIYRDVKGEGDKYRSRYGQQIAAARQREKSSGDEKGKAAVRELEEKLKGHLERLFGQLKQRLERLPTRAQRRDAGPGDLDKPEPSKVKEPVKPMAHDGP